jgi:hypothetical protein
MHKPKLLVVVLVAIAIALAAVGAGWKWHAPKKAFPAPSQIAGWTWDLRASHN